MAEATAAVAAPLPVELLQIVYRTGRRGMSNSSSSSAAGNTFYLLLLLLLINYKYNIAQPNTTIATRTSPDCSEERNS